MSKDTRLKGLVVLAIGSAGVLLISNLTATKLWDFCGIPVDGGILIFPLSYIIGDVVVELYGKKMADYIIKISFGLNLLAVITFLLVGLLPAYADWQGQAAYMAIFGFVPRVVLGSFVAYVLSGLMNNLIFVKIKQRTGDKKLWLRTIGSSVVAKLVDITIFETIAFLGVLSIEDFWRQAIFAYVAGMALEIVFTPLTYLVVRVGRKRIGNAV